MRAKHLTRVIPITLRGREQFRRRVHPLDALFLAIGAHQAGCERRACRPYAPLDGIEDVPAEEPEPAKRRTKPDAGRARLRRINE